MKFHKSAALESYLISILIHVILILGLSLFTISQSEKIKELDLNWITTDTPDFLQEDFTPLGSAGSRQIDQTGSSGNLEGSKTGDSPPTENVTAKSRIGRSIEPPVVKSNAETSSSPHSGSGSSYLSGVKTRLGSGSSGSSGYQLDDDGGNISVLKSVLPSPAISDYGLVKLQFRIRSDGNVDPESITPVILDDPIYTEASIKALRQWRFSVKNQISSKTYRISFIFKPE